MQNDPATINFSLSPRNLIFMSSRQVNLCIFKGISRFFKLSGIYLFYLKLSCNCYAHAYTHMYIHICFEEISHEPAQKVDITKCGQQARLNNRERDFSGFWQLNRLIQYEYCSNWNQYICTSCLFVRVCVCVPK